VSLPKEKQVELVISHKENIVKLTDRILEILHEVKEKKELDKKQELSLRQLINNTVSEMAIIAGFCGSNEREWINSMMSLITTINMNLEFIARTHIIETWCTDVNSITLDFNKTPFKFFGADFKLKLHDFEVRVKGLVDRRESQDKSS